MSKGSPNPTLQPNIALIEEELARVLNSPLFLKSPVVSRLLSFLVEQDLAGESYHLKETFVGHIFYGRDLNYDPKLDSVVRVNANRLRLRLDEYYKNYSDASLRISLPKGSYIPVYVLTEGVAVQPSVRGNTLLSTTNNDGSLIGEIPCTIGADICIQTNVALDSKRQSTCPAQGSVESTFSSSSDLPSASREAFPIAWFTQPRFLKIVGSLLALCLIATTAVTARNAAHSKIVWNVKPFSRLNGLQEFSAFSPDGMSLAFSWLGLDGKNQDIYIQNLHADSPQRLTTNPAEDTRPTWSPDGRSIAFIRLLPEQQRKELNVISVATGKETKVTELEGMAPWLCEIPRITWSPDGTELYTSASFGTEQACGIVAISVSTGNIRPITHPTSGAIADVEPALSPNGSQLAFLRNSGTLGGDIYVIPAGGDIPQRVTFDNRDIMGFCWSADGKSIIAASRRGDGIVKLWRMPLDHGQPQQLTDGAAVAAFPSTSPDGNRIAFTAYHNVTGIWRSRVSTETQLIDNQSGNSTPRLSPDGTSLLYRSDRTGAFELWISDSNGHNSRRLTHLNGPMVDNPIWSPDGKQIAFECRDLGHSDICLIPADGKGAMQRVTQWKSNQILPSWSRDGRSLYYGSNFSGRWEIYLQPLGGGDPIQVTHEGGMRAIESWDGRFLYVHRGEPLGGILIVPVTSIGVTIGGSSNENNVVLNQLTGGMWGSWDAGPDGIVFLTASSSGSSGVIGNFNPADGIRRTLAKVSSKSPDGDLTFSVAPDGNSFLYVRATAYAGVLDILEQRRETP